MRKLFFIITLASLFTLQSCEKPEKLYPKPVVSAGTQTYTFNMGSNYENQIWFDLSTQKMASNHPDGWEIGFSTSSNHKIILNCGKNQEFSIAKFVNTGFDSFTTIDVKKWVWEIDNPTGFKDSLAIRDWCTYGTGGALNGKNILYVLDRGKDYGSQRFVKFKVNSQIGGVYYFSWSWLQDTSETHHVYLNTSGVNYNYVYYSFGDEKQVANEIFENPEWDIVFTSYKKYIPDPNGLPYAYILRGVLTNPKGVKALELPGSVWDNITLDFAKSANYSADEDEIGYDWKIWNMSANKYTMANKCFIIKDIHDNYFKLKFVDFYDDNGNKGYPKMAWELLK